MQRGRLREKRLRMRTRMSEAHGEERLRGLRPSVNWRWED